MDKYKRICDIFFSLFLIIRWFDPRFEELPRTLAMANESRQPYEGSAAHLVVPPEQTAWIFQLETILEEQGEIERTKAVASEGRKAGSGKGERGLPIPRFDGYQGDERDRENHLRIDDRKKWPAATTKKLEDAIGWAGRRVGLGGGSTEAAIKVGPVTLNCDSKNISSPRKAAKRKKKTDSSQSTSKDKDAEMASDILVGTENNNNRESDVTGTREGKDEKDHEVDDDDDDAETSVVFRDSSIAIEKVVGPTIPAVIVTKKVKLPGSFNENDNSASVQRIHFVHVSNRKWKRVDSVE